MTRDQSHFRYLLHNLGDLCQKIIIIKKKKVQRPNYSLEVEAYFTLLERVLLKDCLEAATTDAVFLTAFLASDTSGFRVEQYDSALRPEKVGFDGALSESLGTVKDPARFLGMARMSSLESFLASTSCLEDAVVPSGCAAVFSVSALSLSEVSPNRARRSLEALVGLGVDRLFDLVRTC